MFITVNKTAYQGKAQHLREYILSGLVSTTLVVGVLIVVNATSCGPQPIASRSTLVGLTVFMRDKARQFVLTTRGCDLLIVMMKVMFCALKPTEQ